MLLAVEEKEIFHNLDQSRATNTEEHIILQAVFMKQMSVS